MVERGENGSYIIDKKTFWSAIVLIITLMGSIFGLYSKFVEAQGDIRDLQDDILPIKIKVDESAQKIAVLETKIDNIDRNVELLVRQRSGEKS
jgi:hypothetical protein